MDFNITTHSLEAAATNQNLMGLVDVHRLAALLPLEMPEQVQFKFTTEVPELTVPLARLVEFVAAISPKITLTLEDGLLILSADLSGGREEALALTAYVLGLLHPLTPLPTLQAVPETLIYQAKLGLRRRAVRSPSGPDETLYLDWLETNI